MSSMLDDPEMKEVVVDFCQESLTEFEACEEILDGLEGDPTNASLFEQFGITVDRVMGAAKTLGAEQIGAYCELGKIIGYKASQVEDPSLQQVTVGVLMDAIELVSGITESLMTGKEVNTEINTEKFLERLKWIGDKYKHIERASVSAGSSDEGEGGEQLSAEDIDALLAKVSKAA